jgi:hypothetical protein
MPSRIGILSSVALVLLPGASPGCRRRTQRAFEIVAPAFELSRVQFASYGYSPVGAFAEKRGELVPFIDANGDGRFDPHTEASGRCDQSSHRCWLDHARLRLLMTTTDCAASTGTWLLGNVYGHDGRSLEATLCDDQGACSEEHRNAFQGVDTVNAIWILDAAETPRARTLSLRAGKEEVRYENVELPAPLRVVDIQIERRGGVHISATADQSIDMASLWVTRGHALQWSSAGQPGVFQAKGAAIEATLPQSVVDACAGACEAYLQFGHVWRDDNVFSLAEVKQKVL